MTVYGSDTFIRANQTNTWGTGTDGKAWTRAQGGGVINVTSNEGTINSSSGRDDLLYGGVQSYGDVVVLCRIALGVGSADTGGVDIRMNSNGSNKYRATMDGAGNLFALVKSVSGTATTISSVSQSWTSGTFYWVKAQAVGTALQAKYWADGTAEPSTWTITVTDSANASGGIGVTCTASSTTVCKFDSFYGVDYVNIENLTAADSFLASGASVLVEAGTVADLYNAQGGSLFNEAATAADLFLTTQGYVPIETLAVTDSALFGGAYLPIDALSVADLLSAQAGAQWSELLSVNDTFLVTQIQTAIEALQVTDAFNATSASNATELLNALSTLLVQGSAAWTDSAPVTSTTLWTQLTTAIDALIAADSFLAQSTFNALEALLASDSFSGTTIPTTPTISVYTAALAYGRDGLVRAHGRDGLVRAAGRDGSAIVRGH